MDNCETDRRVLRALAETMNMDPDEPICPDIDRIADTDMGLHAKMRLFRDEAVENMRNAKRQA